MENSLKITKDGSHTLFSPMVQECYHSENGAIQESEHIFIKAGWESCDKTDIKIFEVGFGTGLNAFLTLLKAKEQGKSVSYTSVEYFPVGGDILNKLNYVQQIDAESECCFKKLHEAVWDTRESITPFFTLEKIQADFTKLQLTDSYDLIYFDAFSPEKQPEMWSQQIFDMLYRHANEGAVLTTYCSKGIVRRAMQAAGFFVERLPGPPGKREILRAIKK
ncbi:SAM-dependent methyltransferase [Paludibacter sp. 221]|uniref:tRNA (5-methylaminomethyl-2-thiouridine)(34)-methyltransferase MnmD n=1 Tax=Paludibacter sp. 221 TaxID=2302939 RepID=UPI0013D01C91|nr:tRNA (5-methylaminomethyl-2-thiouridine)(34)-methyltransferase MnmD [Paludibacter sp. 221]NDV47410.1 SAM-dependent methyltransferase [Paludibacter sp. 221]